MYIIIKGSVSIIKQSPEYGPNPIQLASLYDGDMFGELALVSRGSNKRAAGIVS